MLEEALTSPTYSPSEAALAMLSFVQVELPAGGASAEARFFRLFSMLCERAFGAVPKQVGNTSNTSNTNNSNRGKHSEHQYRHAAGGWFSRDMRWERPRSQQKAVRRYGVPQSVHAAQANSIKTDPVIKLLGTGGDAGRRDPNQQQQRLQTLIEAISKEAEHRPNVRYPFPFHALPRATQEAWLALLEIAMAGMTTGNTLPNENASRLLGSLLKVRPVDQMQLRAYHQRLASRKEQQRRPLQLSPGYSNMNMNMNMNGFPPMSPTNVSKDKFMDEHPSIMLSMLEYYLMMYIRYPLASPPPAKQPVHMAPQNFGPARRQRRPEQYGHHVYQHLFYDYLEYFIPNNRPQGHFSGFDTLQRPSELFIRFIIELWMQGMNRLEPTELAFQRFQQRRQVEVFDLSMAYDLVQCNYDPPVATIRRSIRYLIARAVTDGALLDAANDWAATGSTWCLTPTLTVLQPHFYNYVRAAFRRAPIHVSGSPFYAAMEAWLVWLEPWNTSHRTNRVTAEGIINSVTSAMDKHQRRKSTLIYPKANAASRFTAAWEPYIAANLHLYVEPLALFLRRARELDFSPREFRRSMNVVRRVFRVFTPEVVTVLNGLLASRQSNARFSSLVKKHEDNLGCHCPLEGWDLSLTSLQTSMHNLLEEAHLQHRKKVRDLGIIDRIEARLQTFFSTGAMSYEERSLAVIVARAKIIVAFPPGYEVLASDGAGTSGSISRSATGAGDGNVHRSNGGVLSADDRLKLLGGTAKISPLDMDEGDWYYAPPQSHELAFLVPWVIRASDAINERLGLHEEVVGGRGDERADKDKGDAAAAIAIALKTIGQWLLYAGVWRINLRFLADYRWILVFFFLRWLRQCIYG